MNPSQNVSPNDPSERFKFTREEFNLISSMIERRSGITLAAGKMRETQIKLSKLFNRYGVPDKNEFLDELKVSDDMLQKAINVLTVGESYFFRNRPHFDALKEAILPKLIEDAKGSRRLRIWCTGCARGEEPYSIAILLRESFSQLKTWNVSIIATDINTEFLTGAREGIYRKWSLRGVSRNIIERYFNKDQQGNFRLHNSIKRCVEFKRFNLADLIEGARPFDNTIDLIICRNVLIYFSFHRANQIVESLCKLLHPNGYLIVGHSEAFPSLGNLQVMYSHATYYYRRLTESEEKKHNLQLHSPSMVSIPGIGVGPMLSESDSIGSTVGRPHTRKSFAPRRSYAPRWSRAPRRSLTPRRSLAPKNPTVPVIEEPEIEHFEPEEELPELTKARDLANGGEIEKALEILSKLAEGAGRLDYRVHFLLAVVTDQSAKVDQAISSLKRAIFLDKGFVIGHYYIGVLYQREGNNKQASRFFNNAKKLLDEMAPDEPLDEADGLTPERLKEIVQGRTEEIRFS